MIWHLCPLLVWQFNVIIVLTLEVSIITIFFPLFNNYPKLLLIMIYSFYITIKNKFQKKKKKHEWVCMYKYNTHFTLVKSNTCFTVNSAVHAPGQIPPRVSIPLATYLSQLSPKVYPRDSDSPLMNSRIYIQKGHNFFFPCGFLQLWGGGSWRSSESRTKVPGRWPFPNGGMACSKKPRSYRFYATLMSES